jgi:hypothetical protein
MAGSYLGHATETSRPVDFRLATAPKLIATFSPKLEKANLGAVG